MTPPLRIAIADDHAMFREGVKSLLQRQPEFAVVAELTRVDDIAPALADTPCDVLLLDVQMDRSALPLVPELARRVAVVLLTMNEGIDDATDAVRAGARGVVYKRFAIAMLFDALRSIAAGDIWLPPALQHAFVADLRAVGASRISTRERDVIRQVARGQRNAEIARHLFISEETVKKHVSTIFQKLGLRDRVQLTLYAVQTGIVSRADVPRRVAG
jgi:two-component system nitrate/nitrite response regulator NarL